jgi:hypothetical protein
VTRVRPGPQHTRILSSVSFPVLQLQMQAACRSPSPEPLSSNLLLHSTHLPPTLSARHPSTPSLWRRLRHHATVRERRPSTALLSRISPPLGSTTPFYVSPHLGLCWRSGTQYGAYPCMLNTGGPPLSRTATPIEYQHHPQTEIWFEY